MDPIDRIRTNLIGANALMDGRLSADQMLALGAGWSVKQIRESFES